MSASQVVPRPTPPARWFRSVAGFGIASFLSDAGHEAASSALPALLLSLGAPMYALGIIEGVSDGLASFAKLAGGWLADVPRRRKPLAVAGYLLTGLSTGAYALAASWAHLLVARMAGWIARGIRGPVRDAMLADAVAPEARGRAFGFHRAMDSAGAVGGPALAAVILAIAPLRAVFWWSLLPGVLSAAAFATLVRTDRTPPVAPPAAFWRSIGRLPAGFRRFLLAAFIFGVGDFARTLLILRATQLLVPGLGPTKGAAAAVSLYIGHNVLYAAASYPVGWMADRFDPQRLIVGGYLLGVTTALLAAFATATPWSLMLLFTVAGLTLAFIDTLEGAITALQVPGNLRGTAFGVLAAANGIGDLISSALVGVLWSTSGPAIAFSAAAALCAAGMLIQAFPSRPGVVS